MRHTPRPWERDPFPMLRRLRAIGTALDHGDKAAERAAYIAFDRAFPGLSKPVAVKPNLRRRGWRRG